MNPEENQYNNLLTVFGQFTIIIMFLPVAGAAVHYNQLNKAVKVFLWYLLATIGVNLLEQIFIWSVNNYTAFWLPYLKKWQIGDTHFIQIIAYVKNFLLLGWFYGLTIKPLSISRWILIASTTLAILSVIDYIWITGYNVPGVFTPTLNGLFTTILPMIQLWFLVRQDQKISLYKTTYFWFDFGLIISYLFTLLFMFFSEKIYQTNFMLFVKFSIAGNCLRILSQLLFAYGFSQSKTLRFL